MIAAGYPRRHRGYFAAGSFRSVMLLVGDASETLSAKHSD